MSQDLKGLTEFLKGLREGFTQAEKSTAVVRRGRKGYILAPGGDMSEAIACPDWETLVEELRLLLHPEHAKGN